MTSRGRAFLWELFSLGEKKRQFAERVRQIAAANPSWTTRRVVQDRREVQEKALEILDYRLDSSDLLRSDMLRLAQIAQRC